MQGRIASFLLLIGLVALTSHAGHAQDYPVRPIKLIVHTTPGSSSDVTARLVAQDMGRRLGQQMVVDNRAGAGGSIGVDVVAKAPADGYTLLVGASSVMVMLPAVSKRKLPYDADADFAPIGRIGVSPFLLVVNSQSGIKSLDELLASAKANPEKISYASAGPGTNPHMLGEMLSLLSGSPLRHVPYKGPGPAQVDLLGGSVDMQFDTPSATQALIRAGKLRALAVTDTTRLAALPEVPTVGELGYPQLQLLGWTALYAPRATPPAVLAKLQHTLKETLQSPQVRAKLQAMGDTETDALIGDALLQEQRKSRARWRKLAQDRGIALD
ncbi:tripartite tricarboxylate transporter substrate binding protein [Verminephrobacter aporrectodeae subsp. tuberculatae]|uniref:Tripartite tricarboxylate transporter substrate binding protein n=1 Tax=Verminephrobacter aporrectodeae subsp. tuberculatae TaxID=1110392 RepID=A0ABT3KYT3_9BURK|nr:tripartite tricarboxylate transporter substrate binding protein [Verminephrobacter aporrectodeae]MCW5258555.1 tripartite tricarboxylate transporter substrate binding protein [Verminephrobacter aporrectodeae subsp. tuberculatae]MCW5323506.1 tripartite tricarboxylate transporter substrate binding protein [Verminephrobacter aporrectodeae subsp. tuberculatae]MCW8198120.1 tripartite tricarboxylate transporter substrate binding protein [Verminephrobacter aporrectodeae subsp. tuberculatae]